MHDPLKYACDLPDGFAEFDNRRPFPVSHDATCEGVAGDVIHICKDAGYPDAWMMAIMTERDGLRFLYLRYGVGWEVHVNNQHEAVALLMQLKAGVDRLPDEYIGRYNER